MLFKIVIIGIAVILIQQTSLCMAQTSSNNEDIWSQWNYEGTIRYGILEQNRTRAEATEICRNNNFQRVVTIKDSLEDEEFSEIYRRFFTQNGIDESNFFLPSRTFWHGLDRINLTTFEYVDGTQLGMYERWLPPAPGIEGNCSTILFRCIEGCEQLWQNQSCDSRFFVVCQSVENRTELDEIQEFLESGIPLTSAQADVVTDVILNATTDENLTPETLVQGVEILTEITFQNPDLEISELAYQNVIETAENYIDFIEENQEEFLNQSIGGPIVLIIEDYLNRVNITSVLQEVGFQTNRLIAEVRYVSPETNLTFTVMQNGSLASISVPPEAVESVNQVEGPGNRSRISFVRYNSSILFPSPFSVFQVISAQVNRLPINNLVFPVNYVLDLADPTSILDVRFIQCAAWSFESSSWNSSGCFVIALSDPPQCGCNHLTNFAILVETFQRPSYAVFDIINSVIGALSCVGFFLTGAIFLWFKDLRQSKPGPVHIHLCFNLFIGFTIFLAGSDKTGSKIGCIIITVVTHYFFLTSWFWMFIEALLLHKMLVVKSQQLDKRFLVYSSLLSYGLPLIIVMINVGVTILWQDMLSDNPWTQLNDDILYNSTYVGNFYCWLQGYSLYFGFLTPGALIFSTNLILFILVIRAFTWGRKKVQSSRAEATPGQQICRIMTVAFMMGIVWVLSVPLELLANVETLTEILTYIVSVLLAIQGILVFYLFCIRNERARRLWLNPIIKKMTSCCSEKGGYEASETGQTNPTSTTRNVQGLTIQANRSTTTT